MATWIPVLRRALLSGTAASATSTAALALVARLEGRGALQPVNATSHWLNGQRAASVRRPDLRHTGVGYVTHHAATLFWAVLFERAIASRRPVGTLPMLRDAVVMSAFAAAVDYIATPKRFTPGWEFVLSKRAMAAAYAAMAAGLAGGALLAQEPTPLASFPAGAVHPDRQRVLRAQRLW